MARNAILQVRHDTQANWAASTLILANGEIAYTSDTHAFKVGDGTKTWSELEFTTGVPDGGTTNQILVKDSNSDFDVSWTSQITVDSATLNPAAALTPTTEGQMVWDATDGTINVQMANSIIQHVGQSMYYHVQADEAITKGNLVMAVGTLGNSGIIKVAKAHPHYDVLTNIPSQRIMGIAANTMSKGGSGYVVHFGKLRQINTNGWNEGDILYADPTVAGGLTSTIPEAPNWKVIVALVITKSATVGEIFIRPTFGSQLNNNESITITNPQDGNVLTYQSGVWINGSGGSSADSVLANQVFG